MMGEIQSVTVVGAGTMGSQIALQSALAGRYQVTLVDAGKRKRMDLEIVVPLEDMANPPQIVDVAMAKLGQQKKSIELAVPNVELAWKLNDVFMQRAGAYTKLMFENKQIRQMPDLNRHVTKQFM